MFGSLESERRSLYPYKMSALCCCKLACVDDRSICCVFLKLIALSKSSPIFLFDSHISSQLQLEMSSSTGMKCARCGTEGHAAIDCKLPFFRAECVREKEMRQKSAQQARMAERAERDARRQEHFASMTCFRCGQQGHSRAACPWSDAEVCDMKRAAHQEKIDARHRERLASMKCFRCGKQGHAKADCPYSWDEACELRSGNLKAECRSEASEAGESDTTVAASMDLIPAKLPPTCHFCGCLQKKVNRRKGEKASRDRCQTCWRPLHEQGA